MKEFSQKGFEKASTNEIVKEAEISKGLLFHYFKDKKSLFIFLYEYCMELCINEFYKKIDLEEKDFFIRLRQISLIKLELINKYPEIFKFMESAYMDSSSTIKTEVDKFNESMLSTVTIKVFDDIDTSRFKDGIDIKKVINIIIWTFEGLGTDALKKAKLLSLDRPDYDVIFAEADTYIEIFKNCFYKQ